VLASRTQEFRTPQSQATTKKIEAPHAFLAVLRVNPMPGKVLVTFVDFFFLKVQTLP
jgi:hypothetical protein